MKLSRFQLYVFGLLLLLLPLTIYKAIWISRTVITKGVVLEIYTTRRWGNTYPRIQFATRDEVITFSGRYNSKYQPGDSLEIRYIPSNPLSHQINTFWNLWIIVFIINGFLLVIWTFLFARQMITGDKFLVTKRGIKRI